MGFRNKRHGLFSRDVPITAPLPTPLQQAQLAPYFSSMAEVSLRLAERLDDWAKERNGKVADVVGILTRLSSDLEQFSAALSANAVRPSALSLSDEGGEQLVAQQRRALELTLSRVALTSNVLLAGEPLQPDGRGISTYRGLAVLMRRCKTIAQALAANLRWQQGMKDRHEDDLAARLYAALREDEEQKP